jgi:hypothetical protein
MSSPLDLDISFENEEKILNNSYPFNKLISPEKLSNEQYHNLDGISASGLKQAWKDPKLYAKRKLLKRLPSPALDMGTALHEALLEPDSFSFIKYPMTPANREKLEIMVNNGKVMFNYLTSETTNEHSLFVKDNGFVRKVRVDAYDKDLGIIYDVKTTRYNSPEMFIKDAYSYGYHLQASFYIDTFRMAGLKADYFAFLVVPSESPCEPFAVQISDRFIEDGREIYTEVVENIVTYNKSNEQVFFKLMDLPQWRLKSKGLLDE